MYFFYLYVSIFPGEIMTNNEIQIRYNALLNEYSQGMDKRALAFIRENFWGLRNSHDIPDILMQAYSETGIFNDNIYLKHLEKIKEIFDIDCNVLEIGGGMLPAFANILAMEQLKLGKGTVTVYDPMLATNKSKHSNLKLVKEPFTLNHEVKGFDLIVGIMPCDATETLIRQACSNRKDFYLFMCGCTHFSYMDMFRYNITPESYQKYIINLANSLINDKISTDTFENKYGLDYPILYKKHTHSKI